MKQAIKSPAAATGRAAQQSANSRFQYNDIDRARNALNAVSPDVDRDTWIKVGMGAKAAGLSFDDWDAWSSNGATYEPAAAKSAWRSFDTDRGISAGTLFWIAGEHGWRDHVRPAHKRQSRVGPRDALAAMAYEATVITVIASDIKERKTCDEETYQRLAQATARIAAAKDGHV